MSMIVDVSAEKENNHDIGLFGISGPEMHYEEDTLQKTKVEVVKGDILT